MSETKVKPISVDDANKMLVLVKPVTDDITRTWNKISSEIEKLNEIMVSELDDLDITLDSIASINKMVQSLCCNIDELEEMGCTMESLERGVIDFPSIIDDERVMLCWSPDDNEVNYHHKPGESADKRMLIRHIVE